jgi:hypothetical protein
VIGVTPAQKPNEPDVIYDGLVNTSFNPTSERVADPSKLFYGTQMCYIFLRLHHALYVRLRIARQLAAAAAQVSAQAVTCNLTVVGLPLFSSAIRWMPQQLVVANVSCCLSE